MLVRRIWVAMRKLRTPRDRCRLAPVLRSELTTGALFVLVVIAMVAAAVVSQESVDVHRRAQLLAVQVRAATQEMRAVKWQANSEVLAGNADLASGGALVRQGVQVMAQLDSDIAQMQRLQPGAETSRLRHDVQLVYISGLQQLARARGPKPLSSATLVEMQADFQPLLNRLDGDAQRTAAHQQAVAAGALERSLVASIGSLLLGVSALVGLSWRFARVRRRTAVAEQAREIERRGEQRIRALVEHSSDVITVLGRDLRVRWQAPSVRRLLGVEPDSLLDTLIASLVHAEDRTLFDGFLQARLDGGAPATIRARLRHADGRWCYVETVAESRFEDRSVEGLVLNMRDVSERKTFEDELRHQALHDALTGLANRALFEDRLHQSLAGHLRAGRSLAVLFVDLDDFKTINDSLGHRVGDVILKCVAARLESLVRTTDTAARFGGDEFAVLLDPIESGDEAHTIAGRILDALSDPLVVDEHELSLSASIGIALSDGSVEADELLRNADMAMYAAKESGKDAVQAFAETMHQRAITRLELRAELQRAVANREFELDYQPIVSLQSQRTVGLEALVRWQHPTRGRLAPDQFVALAEETGLIVSMGRWILEEACAQARQWELALNSEQPFCVSVNVSIRQLSELDFPEVVAGVLARTALEHKSLVLEITESRLADDQAAIIRQLLALKQLGLRIAIDDFGTGYSALSQLQQLPIDILKIDKSFIEGLRGDMQTAELVQGIVNLGNTLHLDVIAEGIEHFHQADQLRAMRAPFGQGFLFARPTRPEAVLALLQAPGALNSQQEPTMDWC